MLIPHGWVPLASATSADVASWATRKPQRGSDCYVPIKPISALERVEQACPGQSSILHVWLTKTTGAAGQKGQAQDEECRARVD
jgi:hypothetical protein